MAEDKGAVAPELGKDEIYDEAWRKEHGTPIYGTDGETVEGPPVPVYGEDDGLTDDERAERAEARDQAERSGRFRDAHNASGGRARQEMVEGSEDREAKLREARGEQEGEKEKSAAKPASHKQAAKK
jgi:hypothetical protein